HHHHHLPSFPTRRSSDLPEKIALATLIHAKMRLEHFRRMHFFIAQLRFAENLRLQFKLHEFLNAFSLRKNLWSFLVNRHAQFVLDRKSTRLNSSHVSISY